MGDPVLDHQCWMRPENMKTVRTVLKIDENTPGTEIAAETAAAMAASSIVFRHTNRTYARSLLNKAKLVLSYLLHLFIKFVLYLFWSSISVHVFDIFFLGLCFFSQLFEFAKSHKGSYDGECPFYCSFSGYNVIFFSHQYCAWN